VTQSAKAIRGESLAIGSAWRQPFGSGGDWTADRSCHEQASFGRRTGSALTSTMPAPASWASGAAAGAAILTVRGRLV
jgi:hypothetical protein